MGIKGSLIARGEVKESTISAVITRADGTVEQLGVIAYYHRNPVLNWLWHFVHRKRK